MKKIFVEPRTKGEFVEVCTTSALLVDFIVIPRLIAKNPSVQAMEGFYERIRDPNTKGAAFFAVCRGKVCI